jgi:peroxiredoxin Q/BCP
VIVKAGEVAPAFTLPGTENGVHREFSLSEYRGGPVVLVFYPADNTPVCTEQLRTYTADAGEFRDVGAQVLAISPQDVASHERFAASQGGFAFPLLSDVGKAVGERYGILGPIGFYRRSTFVVDGEGVVRFAHRSRTSMTFRPGR